MGTTGQATYMEDHVARLQAEIERTTRRLEMEKRKLHELGENSRKAQHEYNDKRLRYSFNKADARTKARKAEHNLIQLENRLAQALVKYNSANNEINTVKATIDKHRRDRLSMQKVFKQVSRELSEQAEQLNEMKERVVQMREWEQQTTKRMEELTKIQEQEREEFKEKCLVMQKELREQDRLLKEFDIRAHRESSNQRAQMRGTPYSLADEEQKFNPESLMKLILKTALLNAVQRHSIKQHRTKIAVFERAMESIKTSTGISDPAEIVAIFSQLEERNYSIMTYVNTLNFELEAIEAKKRDLEAHIQQQAQHEAAAQQVTDATLRNEAAQISKMVFSTAGKNAIVQHQLHYLSQAHAILQDAAALVGGAWSDRLCIGGEPPPPGAVDECAVAATSMAAEGRSSACQASCSGLQPGEQSETAAPKDTGGSGNANNILPLLWYIEKFILDNKSTLRSAPRVATPPGAAESGECASPVARHPLAASSLPGGIRRGGGCKSPEFASLPSGASLTLTASDACPERSTGGRALLPASRKTVSSPGAFSSRQPGHNGSCRGGGPCCSSPAVPSGGVRNATGQSTPDGNASGTCSIEAGCTNSKYGSRDAGKTDKPQQLDGNCGSRFRLSSITGPEGGDGSSGSDLKVTATSPPQLASPADGPRPAGAPARGDIKLSSSRAGHVSPRGAMTAGEDDVDGDDGGTESERGGGDVGFGDRPLSIGELRERTIHALNRQRRKRGEGAGTLCITEKMCLLAAPILDPAALRAASLRSHPRPPSGDLSASESPPPPTGAGSTDSGSASHTARRGSSAQSREEEKDPRPDGDQGSESGKSLSSATARGGTRNSRRAARTVSTYTPSHRALLFRNARGKDKQFVLLSSSKRKSKHQGASAAGDPAASSLEIQTHSPASASEPTRREIQAPRSNPGNRKGTGVHESGPANPRVACKAGTPDRMGEVCGEPTDAADSLALAAAAEEAPATPAKGADAGEDAKREDSAPSEAEQGEGQEMEGVRAETSRTDNGPGEFAEEEENAQDEGNEETLEPDDSMSVTSAVARRNYDADMEEDNECNGCGSICQDCSEDTLGPREEDIEEQHARKAECNSAGEYDTQARVDILEGGHAHRDIGREGGDEQGGKEHDSGTQGSPRSEQTDDPDTEKQATVGNAPEERDPEPKPNTENKQEIPLCSEESENTPSHTSTPQPSCSSDAASQSPADELSSALGRNRDMSHGGDADDESCMLGAEPDLQKDAAQPPPPLSTETPPSEELSSDPGASSATDTDPQISASASHQLAFTGAEADEPCCFAQHPEEEPHSDPPAPSTPTSSAKKLSGTYETAAEDSPAQGARRSTAELVARARSGIRSAGQRANDASEPVSPPQQGLLPHNTSESDENVLTPPASFSSSPTPPRSNHGSRPLTPVAWHPRLWLGEPTNASNDGRPGSAVNAAHDSNAKMQHFSQDLALCSGGSRSSGDDASGRLPQPVDASLQAGAQDNEADAGTRRMASESRATIKETKAREPCESATRRHLTDTPLLEQGTRPTSEEEEPTPAAAPARPPSPFPRVPEGMQRAKAARPLPVGPPFSAGATCSSEAPSRLSLRPPCTRPSSSPSPGTPRNTGGMVSQPAARFVPPPWRAVPPPRMPRPLCLASPKTQAEFLALDEMPPCPLAPSEEEPDEQRESGMGAEVRDLTGPACPHPPPSDSGKGSEKLQLTRADSGDGGPEPSPAVAHHSNTRMGETSREQEGGSGPLSSPSRPSGPPYPSLHLSPSSGTRPGPPEATFRRSPTPHEMPLDAVPPPSSAEKPVALPARASEGGGELPADSERKSPEATEKCSKVVAQSATSEVCRGECRAANAVLSGVGCELRPEERARVFENLSEESPENDSKDKGLESPLRLPRACGASVHNLAMPPGMPHDHAQTSTPESEPLSPPRPSAAPRLELPPLHSDTHRMSPQPCEAVDTVGAALQTAPDDAAALDASESGPRPAACPTPESLLAGRTRRPQTQPAGASLSPTRRLCILHPSLSVRFLSESAGSENDPQDRTAGVTPPEHASEPERAAGTPTRSIGVRRSATEGAACARRSPLVAQRPTLSAFFHFPNDLPVPEYEAPPGTPPGGSRPATAPRGIAWGSGRGAGEVVAEAVVDGSRITAKVSRPRSDGNSGSGDNDAVESRKSHEEEIRGNERAAESEEDAHSARGGQQETEEAQSAEAMNGEGNEMHPESAVCVASPLEQRPDENREAEDDACGNAPGEPDEIEQHTLGHRHGNEVEVHYTDDVFMAPREADSSEEDTRNRPDTAEGRE
ncbi:hypothetical protein BESB_066210 [Besnoitia besnoiti]|uniref:ODAD1 central coiled coil region domain-containing protein n=1 Tax=Besnoitia besnoiti TaxID=94643 RepID=A0A2A9M7X3_BESBE|nr:hypothetical protein BESB_066210 [Besnoitia besnoiti]PFH34588.1 hypothetical protein BESB_066210 [Besnoitia besnoiti]